MGEPIAANARPRRLRFGLRGGFWAVAVVAVALALVDTIFRAPYRDEQRAAAALVRLGGNVLLVDDSQSWLKRHVGFDLFDTRVAASVDLRHSRVTDADLIHLAAFRHVGQLILSDAGITDAGLEHIRRVGHVALIDLSRTRVTNASPLFGDQADDHPLVLKLAGNRVAPEVFHLSDPKLRCGLQELDLSETDADDQTLNNLPEGLISLSKLDLCRTDITDAGLDSLMRLDGLSSLDLSSTKVTAGGVARLLARWKGRNPLKITTGPAKLPILPDGKISK